MEDSSTAELRQLRAELSAEFAALHQRFDRLESGQRHTHQQLATVGDSVNWQGVINEAIFCLVCAGLSLTAVSLDAIHSNVCPRIPGWLYPVIPFNFVLCPQQADDSAAATTAAVDQPEIMAFLDSLAWAEGTVSADNDGYNVQYTFSHFSDYSHHPAEIKCSGSLCSDAAGRYQFLSTTWASQAAALGLTDFSPRSQDLAAIQLLKANGAYSKILAGDIAGAVVAVRSVWASLPESGHGQPEKSLDEFLRVYQERLAIRKQQHGSSTRAVEVALGWVGKEFAPGQREQCATFIREVLRSAGIDAGVTARAVDGQPSGAGLANSFFGDDVAQIKDGTAVPQPGDLIAYQNTYGSYPAGTITHVALYVGNGQVVDRPTANRPVQKRSIDSIGRIRAIATLKNAAPKAQPKSILQPAASTPAAFVGIKLNDGLLCSGFAVAANRVVTAAHCLDNPQTATVVPQSGDWLAGRVLKQDSSADLALIQVDGASFSPISISSSLPAVGSTLTSFGHPEGAQAIASAVVKVTAASGDKITAAAVSQQKVLPGFSGGPVLSSGGELVGMNDKANDAGAAILVPAEVVKRFAQ